MSNFSFSHSVFERLVSQRRQKVSLCGNELKAFADDKLHIAQMTISFIAVFTLGFEKSGDRPARFEKMWEIFKKYGGL